ncbi:hypothetical protein EDM80_15290 [bacterium]|nr:MAG: hypothetical protein EDM80_15290 [bacterium]
MIMRKSAFCASAVTLAIFLSAVASAQEKPAAKEGQGGTESKLTISTKWKLGDQLRYRYTEESKIVQKSEDETVTSVHRSQSMIMWQLVEKVDEKGCATVAFEYESIVWKQESEQGILQWDSAKPDEGAASEPAVKAYRAMVGKRFTMVSDPDGKITSVKGFDAIIEEIVKEFKDTPAEESVRKTLEGSFSDKAMVRMIGAASNFLPGKPVAKGEEWAGETQTPLPGMGTMEVKAKYKLAEITESKDERIAKITGEATMTLAAPKEGEESVNPILALFDVTIDKGNQSAEILFNADRGVLVSQVLTQNFDMTMKMKTGDFEMKQSATTVTRVERLPEDTKESKDK